MKKILCILCLAVATRAEIPAGYAEKVADAIYKVEGGKKAKVPYGILSVKVKNEEDARRICLNTIKNNWKRWEKAGKKGDFIDFLANKYAPIGAENDPKNLNKNWSKNIHAIMGENEIK